MSTSKKILYVITKSNWGGAQRYVHDLATNITKSDYTILVALGGQGELKSQLRSRGISTISLLALERDIKIIKDVMFFFELLKILQKERPDVIHLNSSKVGGLGALAARIFNIKMLLARSVFRQSTIYNLQSAIVFTIHGLPHLEPRPLLQRQAIKLLTWLTVLLSHRVITVCEHDRLRIVHWPLIKNKVETVYNGIETTEHHDKQTARSQLGKIFNFQFSIFNKFSNDNFIIGTIAELHPNKGLHHLIESFDILNRRSKISNLKLLIIGEGDERRRLEELIERHELSERVFLLGHVADAARYLKAFDLFVLPSLKEGFPYVLLEAAGARVPIVATYTGGIQDLIEHRHNGHLVPPGDNDRLAEVIFSLQLNRAKREMLASKMYEHVNKNHTLNQMIENTVKVYMY
jgi:glycosyltransferase involved in cell wall biosynthesis